MSLDQAQRDTAFRLYYGDNLKLGEVARDLGCTVYDLSPWLLAPARRMIATCATAAAAEAMTVTWQAAMTEAAETCDRYAKECADAADRLERRGIENSGEAHQRSAARLASSAAVALAGLMRESAAKPPTMDDAGCPPDVSAAARPN